MLIAAGAEPRLRPRRLPGVASRSSAGCSLFGWDYILFPALAGFMVVGPILAIGLYEKSRRIAAGEPVSLLRMIFVRPASGGQILFTGVLLCLLMLLWMRAAVIIYALFFGLRALSGSRSYRDDAVHDADRLGDADRRQLRRRAVRRLLLRDQRLLDSDAARTSASTLSRRWGRAWRWSGTICRSC